MAKYRKKPIVIEAVQFEPWGIHKRDLPAGVKGIPSYSADNWNYDGCEFFIDTLEGRHVVTPGDWIIKGIAGELYPCKPEIFEATYEEVVDA